MSEYHIPVMLKESIDGLVLNPEGDYVDATFGGGGHSSEILSRINEGRLFAFDQDADTTGNAIKDDRFFFIMQNFKYLKNFLRYYGVSKVDGILADLGVSSHDFDVAERGFSFRMNAELDMRMNQKAAFTAKQIINDYSEAKLKEIFGSYGEIKNAGKLASKIVEARKEKQIRTTFELKEAVAGCYPMKIENKYLAQLFQALRIEVNDELKVLTEFLEASLDSLKVGGRLVVMTYHSLEDRLVKNFFKTGNFEGKIDKDFYGNVSSPFKLVNRKVIIPTEEEQKLNPRSRSAKLRVAEKL